MPAAVDAKLVSLGYDEVFRVSVAKRFGTAAGGTTGPADTRSHGTSMWFGRADQRMEDPGVERSAASFHVVGTDLRFPGGTSTSLVDEIIAATNAGYRIGLITLGTGTARLGILKHRMVFADWRRPFPVDVERVLITVGKVPADRHGVYYYRDAVDRAVPPRHSGTGRAGPRQWCRAVDPRGCRTDRRRLGRGDRPGRVVVRSHGSGRRPSARARPPTNGS